MGLFSSAPAAESKTSQESAYTPPKRNERQQCWVARDAYFACLDKNNILNSIKDKEQSKAACGREEEGFEKDCASSWVIYFKQKRVADFERAQKIKKLEAEGAVPVAQAQEPSKWKLW